MTTSHQQGGTDGGPANRTGAWDVTALEAGDRVEFRLWPNDVPYTGTVEEVREAVPQTDPRIRHVDNEVHAWVDIDTGGRAMVAVSELHRIES